MLTKYKGASNSREIFAHLVGEKIVAAFESYEDGRTHVWLVLESGDAFVLGGGPGPACGPSFWKESKANVERVVAARRREIDHRLAELRDMAGMEGHLVTPG
jgi:hypothetical protein